MFHVEAYSVEYISAAITILTKNVLRKRVLGKEFNERQALG